VLTVAAWNAVSRVTGFARLVIVGAVLGASFLGNAYQQSNLVSTILFEVLAAGLLSVPLLPALVRHPDRAGEMVRSLWALSLAFLGGLAVLLAVAGRPLMAALTSQAPQGVAEEQIRLGAFLLWFFAPQLVLYAAGALATAWLNARSRFAAAAAAPVANNLTVILTMGVFAIVEGVGPELPISRTGAIVLGVGTTLGVAAMAGLPALAGARVGLSLRPRSWWGVEGMGGLAREGAWAGALLGAQQILLGATLVMANRSDGGVVAAQVAYTFFLLPHALLAHPVYTTTFPRLATAAATHDRSAYRAELAIAARRLGLFLAPATLGLLVIAPLALPLLDIGAFGEAGVDLTVAALRFYALGLLGFGAYMLLCRAWAALGRTSVAGMVSLIAAGGGAVLMYLLGRSTEGTALLARLALAHSAAMTAAAIILALLLVGRDRELVAS
jgi:putative peptidoglycan lipid II flippase